jgi:beta-N-acetylhexosaminidase
LGFDGVVFSDDMQMGAIVDNYGFEDAIVRAINAGCDVLILSNNGAEYDDSVARRARDIILQAVLDGQISESRINESYARIIKMKEKLK